jgi:isopenicillin N synthase-like dioxygenase
MQKDEIPVVSMRECNRKETLQVVDYACREWGFFQAVDHGIEPAVIQRLSEEMHHLFALSGKDKRQIERTAVNPWGFYDQELTKNTRDWKQIFDCGPEFMAEDGSIIRAQWPEQLTGFRAAVENYYQACERLAFDVLGIIADNLGEDPEQFSEDFRQHTSFLRMNYYPVCADPEVPEGESEPVTGHLALNRHTDSGAITLLLQDGEPGLQVFRRGRWYLVPPLADAITVNIGDIVQVWSNDNYRAAIHRVLANPLAERFSVPFFFNPSYEAMYQPLPSMVSDQQPARYQQINWGEFRSARMTGDYGDYGDEIQISHYRLG